MLQNQCRAFCQCEYCKRLKDKDSDKGDECCIHICGLHDHDNGPSKDELYARCLQKANQKRALAASTKNAHLFVPDELLASSRAKREAKDREIASQLVPVRRRDRLQELLLLEHASRIREAKKLRAERRAQGLPADSDEDVESNNDKEVQNEECPCIPSGQPHRSESTPSSKCSAEHDLHSTLDAIGNIVNDFSYNTRPTDPLNRTQIFQLRKLVHERAKKDRKQVEECPNQPHLCPHCFAVNVQGKHLCPQMSGSVAFRTTGKVINPNNRVKFGVKECEALSNGQYDDSVTRSGVGKSSRLEEFNPHPYGTGVIFPPLRSADDQASKIKPRHVFFSDAPAGKPEKELFNNNICDCQPAQNYLQYPGSTYNVYDDREGSYGHAGDGGYSQENGCDSCRDRAVEHSAKGEHIIRSGAAEGAPQSGNELMKNIKSTSALWRTTNMEREADLERFLNFQKKCLKAASKDVYGAGVRVS